MRRAQTAPSWYVRTYPVLVFQQEGRARTWVGKSGRPFLREPGSVILYPASAPRRSEITSDAIQYLAAAMSFEAYGGVNLLSFFQAPLLLPEPTAGICRETLTRLFEMKAGRGQEIAAELETRELCLRLLRAILACSEPLVDLTAHSAVSVN